MATGNNRKENTFRQKAQPEPEFMVEREIVAEEPIKEEKTKKESPKKAEKALKNKEPKPQKPQKERKPSDGKNIDNMAFISLQNVADIVRKSTD